MFTSIKKRLIKATKTCRLTETQIKLLKQLGANKLTKYFGTRGAYTVQLPPPGGRFTMHSSNSFSDNRLMRLGLFYNEKQSKRVWIALCAMAETVADVGANVGQFVLMALAANPKLAVHAFEPFPQNVDALRQNLAANPQFDHGVVVHALALSHSKGQETLYFGKGDIYTPSLTQGGVTNASITVATDTMDAMLPMRIDLVKMDIEGAEPYVLRGMSRILAESQPLILIEVLRTETGAELDALLKPFDYAYFFIDEDRGLVPSTTIDRRHQHSHNFLMVPRSKLQQLPGELMA
jgi:FkbM family methyltransferase